MEEPIDTGCDEGAFGPSGGYRDSLIQYSDPCDSHGVLNAWPPEDAAEIQPQIEPGRDNGSMVD